MLGVERDASQERIKRAYLELARRYHPDRQEGGSRADRDAAGRRMREVNAAWDALRTPARRADYDRQLRGAERPVWERPSPSGPARAPRTATVRTAPSPPSGVMVPAEHAFWFKFVPVALLAVVLIGILVFTAYAAQQDNASTATSTPPPAGPSFQAGDCIYLGSVAGRLLPLPAPSCDSPGAQEVDAVLDLGRPCAPGTRPFDLQEEKLRLCLRA